MRPGCQDERLEDSWQGWDRRERWAKSESESRLEHLQSAWSTHRALVGQDWKKVPEEEAGSFLRE